MAYAKAFDTPYTHSLIHSLCPLALTSRSHNNQTSQMLSVEGIDRNLFNTLTQFCPKLRHVFVRVVESLARLLPFFSFDDDQMEEEADLRPKMYSNTTFILHVQAKAFSEDAQLPALLETG